MTTKAFYQYTFQNFCTLFEEAHLPPSSAKILYNWFYRLKRQGPITKSMAKTDISQKSIEYMNQTFDFSLPRIDRVQKSLDRTVKLSFELKDKKKVETVIIPFQGKYTICLSSQVGCAMKCSFCFTGTQGLKRNLETYEIVGQFMAAQHWLNENRPEDNRILNLVFMGQGEPLHNFNAVKEACQIFIDTHGICLAKEKITVSTAGYLPGMKRWIHEMPEVNLALSLHSPIKEKRDELIPLNKSYPLSEVLALIDTIPLKKKRWITYEYLIIKNFNDEVEDAYLVKNLLKDKPALINIIPFNPFPGSKYQRPSDSKIFAFQQVLQDAKIHAIIRKTKGDTILAACGQLHSEKSFI